MQNISIQNFCQTLLMTHLVEDGIKRNTPEVDVI